MNTLLFRLRLSARGDRVRPWRPRYGRTLGGARKASGASWSSRMPSMRHAWRSSACPGVTVFGEVKPEPDIPNLDQAVALAVRLQPDLVVGFGGGSAIDLAKLVAVLPGSEQTHL